MSGLIAVLPNAQLLARVRELVERGNEAEAELLAHLGEVDARRLYLEEGCSSMFVWCQGVLHFADGVAYKRIQAARAARQFPEILEAVRSGDLHLTAVGLLAPKLTAACSAGLIAAARHRSADEIKRILADREPKPDVPTSVQHIAEPARAIAPSAVPPALPPAPASPTASVQARAPLPEPLGADRYRVQFTADRATHAQLEELRALMRHQIPDGDVGKILAKAIFSSAQTSSQTEVCRDVQSTSWSNQREGITTYPRRDPTCRLATRWRPLHLCLSGRPAL